MTHKDIWEIFKILFPMYSTAATQYFSNGKHSIRIRISTMNQDFVFTYHDKKEWRFETVDIYAKSLVKESK